MEFVLINLPMDALKRLPRYNCVCASAILCILNRFYHLEKFSREFWAYYYHQQQSCVYTHIYILNSDSIKLFECTCSGAAHKMCEYCEVRACLKLNHRQHRQINMNENSQMEFGCCHPFVAAAVVQSQFSNEIWFNTVLKVYI